MTDKKLRALIIGGDRRNLTDTLLEWVDVTHVEQYEKKVPAAAQADVVVVITRWVSHGMYENGKKFAKARGIPVLQAHTGNYIVAELIKSGLLPKEAEEDRKKKKSEQKPAQEIAPPPTVAPTTEPVKEESTGLDPDQLWDLYGTKAILVIKSSLKPGEKIHEDDILELFATPDIGVGLPKETSIHLLPTMVAYGVLIQAGDKVWQSPKLDVDYNYKTGEVAESETPTPEQPEEIVPVLAKEVKARVKHETKKRAEDQIVWVSLLGGLNPGPYPSQVSIWREALEHIEFSKPSGQPLGEEYYWKIIPLAIEYGVVERHKDGSYTVVPDATVTLTRRDGKGRKAVRRVGRPKVDPEPVPVAPDAPKAEPTPIPKPPPKAEEKKEKPKTGDPIKIVRKHYGGSIPTLDRFTAVTKTLKRMVPQRYWNELASRQVAKLIGVRDHGQCEELEIGFDAAEWDRIAIDMLMTLPVLTILPFLKELPQDYDLTCIDCAAKFMFTVSEQDFIRRMVDEKKFDTFEIPKRCIPCRKKLRANRL
jgi:hypothetical protein